MSNQNIKISQAQLKEMIMKSINENVDEAWYNNKEDFKKGAKKVGKNIAKGAAGTALAAGMATGGLHCLDKGLENQERYEQNLNRQAKYLGGPTNDEVKQWCIDHEMDPNDANAIDQAYEWLNAEYEDKYGDSMDNVYESKNSKKIKITESKLNAMIMESIKKAINEIGDTNRGQYMMGRVINC